MPNFVQGDIVRENPTTNQSTGRLDETDITTVQTATYGEYAPTDGDVITLYSDASYGFDDDQDLKQIGIQYAGNPYGYGIPYSVSQFTIRGGEDNGSGFTPKMRTISINFPDGYMYQNQTLYCFSQDVSITLTDLNFRSIQDLISTPEEPWVGAIFVVPQLDMELYPSSDAKINLTLTNVSFQDYCKVMESGFSSASIETNGEVNITNSGSGVYTAIDADKVDFTNNGTLTINNRDGIMGANDEVTFTNNGVLKLDRMSSICYSGGQLSFINNSNGKVNIYDAGDLYDAYSSAFHSPSLNITNNDEQVITLKNFWNGCVTSSVTFTGTGVDFTNNLVTDIEFWHFVNDDTGECFPFVLTFSGAGRYSFDGGINRYSEILFESDSEDELYKDMLTLTTNVTGASVSVSGRENRGIHPDTGRAITTDYNLGTVNLSEGGNLTVVADKIDNLFSNTKFLDADSVLTVKNGEHSATIKSSGGDGTALLIKGKGEYQSRIEGDEGWEDDPTVHYTYQEWLQENGFEAAGLVGNEGLFISSGRIDVKGCFDQSIVLLSDASFSPGNSAGTVEIDGDFIAVAGSTLIFEQEGNVYDKLTADNVTIDPAVDISFVAFTFAPGTVYDIIIANGELTVDSSWIDKIQTLLPSDFTASIFNGNTVRLQSSQEPQTAVPEPSTWALLVLGVAGLFYVRKRRD